MTHHTGSDEGRALADVIAKHRSPTERSDNGTPMCDCGHDLGWDESWPEHLASVLAARAAAPDALRERVEALADRWEIFSGSATDERISSLLASVAAEVRLALAERPTDGAGT